MKIELTITFRTIPRMITGLQELWLSDEPKKHAETTGFVLGQMITHPRTTAERLLPEVTNFVSKNGPHGIDSIFLSALSASSLYNIKNFEEGIKVAKHVNVSKLPESKPEFFIDFTDLAVEAMDIFSELLNIGKNRSHSAYSLPGLGNIVARINAAKKGFRTPGFNNTFFSEFISKLYPDGIRNSIYANMPDPSQRGMLPGFGIALRGALSPFDEYRFPSASAEQSGRDNAKAEKDALTAQVFTHVVATRVGVPEGQIGANQLFAIIAAFAAGFNSTGAKAECKSEAPSETLPWELELFGQSKDPDAEVKMPIPGEPSGGQRPSIWEIFEAYQRYIGRLDPLIRPMQEDVGGGVSILRLPQPGNVDPQWSDTEFTLTDEELRRHLSFIQAKYFDSLINPEGG